MSVHPSGLVSSGKALGGSREGVGSCGSQINSSPPTLLAAMGLGLLFLLLLLWTAGIQGSELDPNGQHVCMGRCPLVVCAPDFQTWVGCFSAICEGLDACQKDEICVKPGLCRCKPGFFGAQCSSRCPSQYWGPDCRETCPCHPHGQCDPATGKCQCQADRWGSRCEFTCACSSHGRCDPETGVCHCNRGWWSSTCRRQCQCSSTSQCDQTTGACLCHSGWWGRRCSFRCSCNGSPCEQLSGRCICQPGWWDSECRQKCQCVRGLCSATSGQCSCPPGFHGARCELPCAPGSYGVQCRKREKGERKRKGKLGRKQVEGRVVTWCPGCTIALGDPGWLGPRCEDSCPMGTFGEGCGSTCPTCIQGSCDAVTGECVCSAGYWGTSCNSSCPSGFHGNNCSIPCQCTEGLCHPVSGACELGRVKDAILTTGILVPLLLLLLGIACWACYRWTTRLDPKDRPVRDGAALSRMKQQVWGALTSLGSALSCGSLSRHKLPWVTVSHHDPEVPFNHSFIEPPSAGWASDDSFSSDPESGVEDEVPAYCVPPQEGMVPVTHAESAEASLAGGPFPPPEDTSTPFAIPRTSSLARAKRPSVSFAEGTKFASQSCRSSGELSSPFRKPKRLSRGAQPGPEGQEAKESVTLEQGNTDEAAPATASPGDSAIDHQYYLEDQTAAECVEAIDSGVKETSDPVATIYMLAGTPQRSEGPVLSIFRHFGNFWKGQAEAKVKTAIPKPPRRALGQNKNSPGLGLSIGVRSEEVSRGVGDGIESSGRAQEPVIGNSPPEQDLQKQAEEEGQEEPLYENVVLVSGPPES
uniref:Scavenger receptor class F member 1 n=1 Tax=Marmota marmota marmota TaxID=9994 RepID=A0A8C6AFM2_MARMA